MNQLKKDEINRITEIFLAKQSNENTTDLLKLVLFVTFGKREGEEILSDFMRERQQISSKTNRNEYESKNFETEKNLLKSLHISQMSRLATAPN